MVILCNWIQWLMEVTLVVKLRISSMGQVSSNCHVAVKKFMKSKPKLTLEKERAGQAWELTVTDNRMGLLLAQSGRVSLEKQVEVSQGKLEQVRKGLPDPTDLGATQESKEPERSLYWSQQIQTLLVLSTLLELQLRNTDLSQPNSF